MKRNFKEEQKFRQWWVWLILLAVALMMAFGVYKHNFRRTLWK